MPNSRLRCRACGTDQEASASEAAVCEICGASFSENATDAPIDLDADPIDLAAERIDLGAEAAAASDRSEVRRQLRTFEQMRAAPPGGAAQEIGVVLAATKRADFFLSLVPLWGPLRLWRSDTHARGEKIRWTAASIAVTLALAVGIIALLPTAAERAEIARARVEADFDEIAALVERYTADTGRYPTAEVWDQTAARGDLRFLDPWNRVYRYRLEPDQFVLDTYGRDGQPGGSADDADLARRVRRRDALTEQAPR